jgi:hypothetical protein
MLELAVTVFASRPQRTSVAEGLAATSTLSRCLRLLLAQARAEERRRIARDLHDGAQQRVEDMPRRYVRAAGSASGRRRNAAPSSG